MCPPMLAKKSDPEKRADNPNPSATIRDIIVETKSLFSLSFPISITALIFYSRSLISMLFLGRLGETELAGGSLAIAFANITGYSVLSGLSLGMEPICSQAYGARQFKIMTATLHRCVIFLLLCSIAISILWMNVSNILLAVREDPNITRVGRTYLLFSLPDLATNSFLHPIRIYLRTQGITTPLTIASLSGALVHIPMNVILGSRFGLAGVAAAGSGSNFFTVLILVSYLWGSGVHAAPITRSCLTGWKPLILLSAPSCLSVCLEWWWYEIITVLCGLLDNPESTVASMGVLIQTTSLLYVFPSSLSYAVSARVGNELGAGRPERAKLASSVAIAIATFMGLSAMTLALLARHSWPRIFTTDGGIVAITAAAIPILGLCEIGNCPQTVGCGVIRGCARPVAAANVNLAAFYLVGMPVAVGSAFWAGYGFCGFWIGLLFAQACCAGLMMYLVCSTDWEYQAKRAHALTGVAIVVSEVDGSDLEQPLLVSDPPLM